MDEDATVSNARRHLCSRRRVEFSSDRPNHHRRSSLEIAAPRRKRSVIINEGKVSSFEAPGTLRQLHLRDTSTNDLNVMLMSNEQYILLLLPYIHRPPLQHGV